MHTRSGVARAFPSGCLLFCLETTGYLTNQLKNSEKSRVSVALSSIHKNHNIALNSFELNIKPQIM